MVASNNQIDLEFRDQKMRLKLWIQLLRGSRFIENEIRDRLRREFKITLPRFDVMAALYRKPDGMLMSELSRYLMVSNGNVTGIVDRLVNDQLVARSQRAGDRRTWVIELTTKGASDFETMAQSHQIWINELLGNIGQPDAEQMYANLTKLNAGRQVENE